MVDCTSLDDFETNKTSVEKMKSITKPLKLDFMKLDFNGKVCRTSVRISDVAKKDFVNFYFIASNSITVI